ncbi:hypothetical protein F1C15_15605 (plasmid) [Frigoribacterium sp. NBH87]|uniref:DUF6286 domain-containing protein n=1 Tax=Frigoribacterium sp. NBH87 TaxID=2596916 RepID=UPI00185FA6B3|nr:DUF6286 domain-containing protein [Frigoribacterium sp. NBH87]QNE45398.1 hypothetical protein F1C15_15605 [Frigoribacterium sp. NBH87]
MLAIILAIILILAAAYAITEIILAMLSQPALLVAPKDASQSLVDASALPVGALIAAGIVLLVVGLILIVVALTAGRRARHVITTDRAVTVVDNEVIASALARHASYAGGTSPDNTRVSVSHRRAVVEVTAASGTKAPSQAILDVVNEQLGLYGFTPVLKGKVDITRAKVGA